MRYSIFTFSLIALACSNTFAATPIDLQTQHASFFRTMSNKINVKETSRHVDFNKTTHIRFQQIFNNNVVWGADGIAHVSQNPKGLNNLSPLATMNGIVYADLEKDLATTPTHVLNSAQAQKAVQEVIRLDSSKNGGAQYDNKHMKPSFIVYVDKKNKAHWAIIVSIVANYKNGGLAIPTYILDANNFKVYEQWNDLRTLENVTGGGFGGNDKMGKLVYDGLQNDYPALSNIQRKGNNCTLENDEVAVKNDKDASGPFDDAPTAKFKCSETNPNHNNVYWDGDQDATNGGYSPVNDSYYIGTVVKNMYQDWYHVPVLEMMGQPMQIVLHAHAKDLFGQPMDNAFFFPWTMQMYFGDGVKLFYPLTSIGVGAHELSHGFTSNHSNLTYEKQSGGLNESYSDMAAQAGEYYSTGKNSWQIGPEIVKGAGALRYMDDPTKDGKSIAHVKDYNDSLNVHYTSGIFNKVFYTLGTTDGWNTRKAFDIMVKANMDYWTANTTFAAAGCGVMKAARDYNYDTAAVAYALQVVGLNASKC